MAVINKPRRPVRQRFWTYMKGHWELYLFLIPGLIVLAMFKFAPMSKIVIAFKNFKPRRGISGSSWVAFV